VNVEHGEHTAGAESSRELAVELQALEKTFKTWHWPKVKGVPLPWRYARKVKAVRGIDLQVHQGEIVGFLGPNGAGKTTTIKMLMGLIKPSGGEMRIYGRSPDELSTRARIGYLPEQPYFYDYLNPMEILDFYGRLFRIPKKLRRQRIAELLELVGVAHAQDRKLRSFSKGMLQRVGIASALINDPDLVVLDEPFSGLDPIGRKDMRDIVAGLRERGRTVFFSSHILSDAELICDKVAIIDRGVMRAKGSLRELVDVERLESEIIVTGLSELPDVQSRLPDARIEKIGVHMRITVDEGSTTEAVRTLLDQGATIDSVTRKRETLEELFIKAAFRRDGEEGAT